MEQQQVKTMEQCREELAAEKQEQQHLDFISSMENKTIKELSVLQQSYLYKEHNKLYMSLKENKEKQIKDLSTLDRLKKIQKENTKAFEKRKEAIVQKVKQEQAQENEFKNIFEKDFYYDIDKKTEELINQSINELFSK